MFLRATMSLMMVGLLNWSASAQGKSADPRSTKSPVMRVYYKNQSFRLPVEIPDSERENLSEIKFFYKLLPGPWVCKETANNEQKVFPFHAPTDGEYWLTFATVDKAGVMAPATMDDEPPGLIVVVDTTPPEVELNPMPCASGQLLLRCRVRDANPDFATLKVQYQKSDNTWQALKVFQADVPEMFCVPDVSILSSKLRVEVADRAKNKVTKEFDMSIAHAPQPCPQLGQTFSPLLCREVRPSCASE